MKVTPEMMGKFEQCKSAEDVLDLAKNNNIVLTKEQAKKAFDLLKSDDISDEALENVAGGQVAGKKYWEELSKPFNRSAHN